MARKKKDRPYETNRYRMGIQVTAGGVSLPNAHVVYEVCYSDGTSRLERGRSVFGVQATNIRNKKERLEAGLTSRPDLYTVMHAAALLNRQVEEACLSADGHYDRAERLKKKRYKDDYS